MKAFLKKYQILIFFTLTFIISWYPWYTGGVGFKAAGPSYAGLIVVFVVSGWSGIKVMLHRLVKWRVGFVWWAVALLGPLAITLAAIGIHVLMGGDAPNFLIWKVEPLMVPVLMLILISPMGGAGGEEYFGWRGYAQPRLQDSLGKWAPLFTSLIIGVVWAVWHLPEFFNPASTQYALGWIGFLPLILMEITNSIIMTWLFNKTGGSVLIAGITWHLMIDTFSTTMLSDFTVTGMLAGETMQPIDIRLIMTLAVIMTILAVMLVVATKGELGFPLDEKVLETDSI
jgi:membrane protease YdiL (CAAX protease family)